MLEIILILFLQIFIKSLFASLSYFLLYIIGLAHTQTEVPYHKPRNPYIIYDLFIAGGGFLGKDKIRVKFCCDNRC